MKMKFGAIVVDGRGKIGGHVASKNRSGAYLRTKVTPVNIRSTAQQNVRNIFGSIAQSWRGLTQDQRDAWNAAVSQWSKTDIFGDLRNPSGISLFQRLNATLLGGLYPALSSPPNPTALAKPTLVSLLADASLGALELNSTVVSTPDMEFQAWATPPISPGISFVKSQYRMIKSNTGAISPTIDLTADYVKVFGSFDAVGQKIFVRIVTYDSVTGQLGVPVEISTIIIA